MQDQNIDIVFLTETWLTAKGDEAECVDMFPAGTMQSLSHDFLVELAYLSSTVAPCKVTFQLVTSDFDHKAFQLMHLKLSVSQRAIHLLCLYRPPPSKKNRMTKSMFFIGSQTC